MRQDEHNDRDDPFARAIAESIAHAKRKAKFYGTLSFFNVVAVVLIAKGMPAHALAPYLGLILASSAPLLLVLTLVHATDILVNWLEERKRRRRDGFGLQCQRDDKPVGAAMNTRDLEGATPLHNAAYWGRSEDIKTLLEAGADLNARDEIGRTLLHFAVMGKTANAEAIRTLLEAGADPNARSESGYTPLHSAFTAEAVTALLQAGADPHARTEFGYTPLHSAATAEAVTALLQAGADLHARNEFGASPLHSAAEFETGEAVTALLEAGADPNARDNDRKLPFDYAGDNEELKGTFGYWKLSQARFDREQDKGPSARDKAHRRFWARFFD